MTLPIYNSGLYGYYSAALTQEAVVSVGAGKFVVIANGVGPNDQVGYVVVEVDTNGVPTFGTPDYIVGVKGFSNPLAYYDKSQDRIVVIFDDVEYAVLSISGTTLVKIGDGTLITSNKTFSEAVLYHEASAKAIIVNQHFPTNTTHITTLSLVGSTLVEFEAVSGGFSGRAFNNNCKLTDCGEYCLLAFVNDNAYPEPEVRVISGMGTANFNYSPGLSLPVASHPYCVGLAGTADGQFIGYWTKNSSDIPYLIGGEITGDSSLIFGQNPLQYAGPDWGDYYGEFMGDGIGVVGGTGVFVNRIDSKLIHMFSVETDGNLDAVVTLDSTSQSGLDLPNYNYDHVSIAYDSTVQYGLCAFNINDASNNSQIYVATLYAEAPVPIFWTNHVKQEENGDLGAGYLQKKQTVSVIPGKAGQPYIPPTPATPAKVAVTAGVNFVCKRVL